MPCPIRVGRNITKCRLTGLPSGVTADPIAAENMLLNMYSTVSWCETKVKITFWKTHLPNSVSDSFLVGLLCHQHEPVSTNMNLQVVRFSEKPTYSPGRTLSMTTTCRLSPSRTCTSPHYPSAPLVLQAHTDRIIDIFRSWILFRFLRTNCLQSFLDVPWPQNRPGNMIPASVSPQFWLVPHPESWLAPTIIENSLY